MAANSDYYVYPGKDGADVIVSRLSDVPPALRSQAKHIDLSQPALKIPVSDTLESPTPPTSKQPAASEGVLGFLTGFHLPSFAMGAISAVALAAVAVLAFRRTTRILSFVVGFLIIGTLGLGYMAYIRKQAGLRPVAIPTPGVFMDDARESAEAMKKRYADQEKAISDAEKQAGR